MKVLTHQDKVSQRHFTNLMFNSVFYDPWK